MYALREQGISYSEIGKRYGMTHQGVSWILNKWFGKKLRQKNRIKIICLECGKESSFVESLDKRKFCNKNCWIKYGKKHKKEINIETKRLKQRERSKEYYSKNKVKVYKIVQKSINKYSYKQKARTKVFHAVKKGILKKTRLCTICKTNKTTDGHHEDYNKPLEVIWCCRVCHRILDRRLKNNV